MITKQAKPHLIISVFKSVCRMTGCLALLIDQTPKTIAWTAFSFLLAETLGITEELFDER